MIHKFKMHGCNIVLDVNSGSVHRMDDLSYELLDCIDWDEDSIIEKFSADYTREEIIEALSEIRQLKESGQLFSEDVFEEYVYDFIAKNDENPVVKALCLHVAHDCNLRCRYCFASTGDFGTSRKLMPPETGKKAIDFIIEKSGSRRNLEIDFFGGEPLLNFKTVREIVEYAQDKGRENNKVFRFTLTTNAVLLKDEHKEFINKYMDNVVLSIDGRPHVNDYMRRRIDSGGTYHDILPKIKDLADSRGQDCYYVRGTFTRKNLDFSKDVLHLADLGFKQISVEPVVAADDKDYSIRWEDLPEIFSEYETLAMEYVKRRKGPDWFNFFHFMIDLENGPCAYKKLKGCGSGDEYLAVTPEGDLYPCHQFVGMEEFKMGNVNVSTQVNQEIRKKFVGQNIYSKPECRKCWAKFFCSGGCTANSMQLNHCLEKPYAIGCELEKKRVECALWAKVMEYEQGGGEQD